MNRRLTHSLYVLLTLGPLVLGLGYSLLYSLGMAGLMGKGFTTTHWARLFADGEVFASIGYTLWLVVASLVLCLLPALLFSWRFAMGLQGNGLHNLLFLPLTFPPLIAGFAWYHVLSPAGLLSRGAAQMGMVGEVEQFPRWVNDGWAIGILVAHVFLIFPFFTIMLSQIARREKIGELFAAATTLGTTTGQFIRRIFLPLILRRAAPVIMLYAVFLFGAYEIPLLLGRSTPRVFTVFISEKIQKFDLTNIPVGHAAAVLYILLTALAVTIFLYLQNRRRAWA